MDMIILIIFIISLILLIWTYCGYPLALLVLHKIKNYEIKKQAITPKVTILICTYKEANVIGRRIKNILESDYPSEKLEIIVVDSASNDGTADIVRKIKSDNKYLKIKLIEEEERKGKASAINLGLKEANGEIVILTDGPTLYDRDTIRQIIKNFADPYIGGVTGHFSPMGGDRSVEKAEKMFWKFKNLLRKLESDIDSTTFLSGELCCFRRELIDKVDTDTLADDANIAIKIRKKGYKVIFDPTVTFYEKIPSNYNDLKIQKVRRAIGSIKETLRFKNMMFNPKYGVFGMLILPTKFLYIPLNPIILIINILCGVILIYKLYYNMLILILFIILVIVIAIFKLRNKIKLLNLLISFLLTQWIILNAVIKYLIRDYDIKWKKIESTREKNE